MTVRSTHRFHTGDHNFAGLCAAVGCLLTVTGHSAPDGKPNPLCKGQCGAVIDRVGGSAHVVLPGVRASFAAASRLLFSAKRATDLGPRGTDVYICDAAV